MKKNIKGISIKLIILAIGATSSYAMSRQMVDECEVSCSLMCWISGLC